MHIWCYIVILTRLQLDAFFFSSWKHYTDKCFHDLYILKMLFVFFWFAKINIRQIFRIIGSRKYMFAKLFFIRFAKINVLKVESQKLKNHKQNHKRYKINNLLDKINWALGSTWRFLAVQGRWEWMILAIWKAYYILFLFCNEPAKKFHGVSTLNTSLLEKLWAKGHNESVTANKIGISALTIFRTKSQFSSNEKNVNCFRTT